MNGAWDNRRFSISQEIRKKIFSKDIKLGKTVDLFSNHIFIAINIIFNYIFDFFMINKHATNQFNCLAIY